MVRLFLSQAYSEGDFFPVREIIRFETGTRETLIDITEQVRTVVGKSGIVNGIATVYAQGATAAIMIQENWDESVQTDVVNFLRKLIPCGIWLHDAQDGNGDAHLKAGLVVGHRKPSRSSTVSSDCPDGRIYSSANSTVRARKGKLCTVLADEAAC